jgi:hypothetical protein
MSTDSASSTGGANLVSDVSQQRVASINSANVTVPETKPGEGPASAPKLHEVSRRSPFGALLSRTLPSYTGSYDVGVCDIEVPVERQTFGNFAHKSMPNKPAGLTLDTVLFSMFYPCEKPNSPKPVVWFPKYVAFLVIGMCVNGHFQHAPNHRWLSSNGATYPQLLVSCYLLCYYFPRTRVGD